MKRGFAVPMGEVSLQRYAPQRAQRECFPSAPSTVIARQSHALRPLAMKMPMAAASP
jgi:hypothetical protein